MGLLYKPKDEQKTILEMSRVGDKIVLDFSSDCGKHGTIEALDSIEITAQELLKVLQSDEEK